ncbi:MAG: 3-hydroxyacyl-CoA dehydrogenase NAD-binding domain-containing protein, partial [Pseudomonadota bacterium]
MPDTFTVSIDAEGIATVSWDLPNARMNVLDEAGIIELETKVPALIADPSVKGVILTSAKSDFAGGMDLPTILDYRRRAEASGDPAGMLFEFTMRIHRLLRMIERGGMDPKTLKGGKPFVWASPGTAVGIGIEIALACHRRMVVDNAAARLGLPEIKIGIFPGAGGTTRLIRMLGLMGASEYLLEGKLHTPERARRAGLVDAVVPASGLLPTARDWVRAATETDVVKPWDRKGSGTPGGAPFTVPGFPVFVGGAALAHAKSRGVYPAVNAMLSAIYEGAQVPFDTALRIEARYFTKTLLDPSADAMIRTLFVTKQAVEKGVARPPGIARKPTGRLGVVGAGVMGAGIAHAAAAAGIDVVLMDRDIELADRGRRSVEQLLERQVKRRRIDPSEQAAVLARVTATEEIGLLADRDLVIEAVTEDHALKKTVLARVERVLAPGALLASNTSSLPIAELAEACGRPERFLGLHFFAPVDRMMLVEVVRGAATSAHALAAAFDFARQINKTPVIVNDARFFFANRCILPFGREGVELVAEGVAPAMVENAAKNAGMPLGPLQLIDEASLSLALRISTEMHGQESSDCARMPGERLLQRLAQEVGRTGRKQRAGFYNYTPEGKRDGLWRGLSTLVDAKGT